MEHIKSGFANAVRDQQRQRKRCIGEQGYADALEIATITSGLLECSPQDILVGSTGVIGKPLTWMPYVPASKPWFRHGS
jgi:glutamate N-acetyltransferase/amino-acid N-acetyltransferase